MNATSDTNFDVLWISITNELDYLVHVTLQQPYMDPVVLGICVTAVVLVVWSLLMVPRD